MSSTVEYQNEQDEYRMSEEEAQTLDHIIYCLARGYIREQGTFVEEDGDDYVIEIAGRLTIARFPLAGRKKRNIIFALENGVTRHRAECEAQGERLFPR